MRNNEINFMLPSIKTEIDCENDNKKRKKKNEGILYIFACITKLKEKRIFFILILELAAFIL